MTKTFLTLAMALLVAVWTDSTVAEPNSGAFRPRVPLGNNPHPVIWGGMHAKPAPRLAKPAAARPAQHVECAGPHHGFGRYYYRAGGCYPNLGGPCGYDAYYGYSYPYQYAYPPLYYYAYPPPLWVAADELYGPRAVQRMMGADGLSQPWPVVNVVAPVADANEDADSPPLKKPKDRATNERANALAWRFIGFGDAQFAQQKYVEANVRYRKASQSAPQLADAWFRQAFALSAVGRFDLAVGVVKRGLKIEPNWARSNFELEELYGRDELTRDAQLDALVAAAEENPNDADVPFMVGVHLHFDGQADRAAEFFRRAAAIAGDDAEHVRAFPTK